MALKYTNVQARREDHSGYSFFWTYDFADQEFKGGFSRNCTVRYTPESRTLRCFNSIAGQVFDYSLRGKNHAS